MCPVLQSLSVCMHLYVFLSAIFTYQDFASLCFKLKNMKNIYMQIVYKLSAMRRERGNIK